MDTDKLDNFGTIKIAHGDSEAVFCIFSQKVRYPCIIRISYNALLSASLLLEYQYLHGQTDLHYLIFLTILMDTLYIIQLDKFTLSFISNRIKPFNDTFQIPPLIFMGQVFLDICLYFLRLIY